MADLHDSIQRLLSISLSEKINFISFKLLITLHENIHTAGEKELQNILKKEISNSSEENINLAKTLSAFHYILNKNHLIEALQSRNSNLLDFLLSTNLYSINNLPLTIDKRIYSSAIHYCFDHERKNKSMVNCLLVLMKRGANIHVANEAGVPFSHILLSTEHSLSSALKSNNELINSIDFYNQLIQNLIHYGNIANSL